MSEKDFYLYIGGKPVKVSKEVYQEYYRGERKERYFMEDLKTERIIVDPLEQTVTIIPGREDSYERLLESSRQFAASGKSVEEQAVTSALVHRALETLTPQERELIEELYFLEKTERQVSYIWLRQRCAADMKRHLRSFVKYWKKIYKYFPKKRTKPCFPTANSMREVYAPS